MAARIAALLPRFAALTLIWFLATSTITFAAGGRPAPPRPAPAPPERKPPPTLVVPDVRRQAFVFAKGTLEDEGFAWRVEGAVGGYAANGVARQRPLPGTEVVDTGSPTIVLELARNPGYAEDGRADRRSEYPGTRLVLASPPAKAAEPPARAKDKESRRAKATDERRPKRARPGARQSRAFLVPGAPRQPRGELPLSQRATLLARRLSSRGPTEELVRHWLYQHAWIVTGARFGWRGGAEALRTLIALDRNLQARWGMGARSAAVARAALAEVERRSRR